MSESEIFSSDMSEDSHSLGIIGGSKIALVLATFFSEMVHMRLLQGSSVERLSSVSKKKVQVTLRYINYHCYLIIWNAVMSSS